MAVLVTAEVPGQTLEGYLSVLQVLGGLIKAAPGFIMHSAHPVEGGCRVIEVWETKKHSDEWYAKNVVPNLPPGVHPKRTVQELHSLVMR